MLDRYEYAGKVFVANGNLGNLYPLCMHIQFIYNFAVILFVALLLTETCKRAEYLSILLLFYTMQKSKWVALQQISHVIKNKYTVLKKDFFRYLYLCVTEYFYV